MWAPSAKVGNLRVTFSIIVFIVIIAILRVSVLVWCIGCVQLQVLDRHSESLGLSGVVQVQLPVITSLAPLIPRVRAAAPGSPSSEDRDVGHDGILTDTTENFILWRPHLLVEVYYGEVDWVDQVIVGGPAPVLIPGEGVHLRRAEQLAHWTRPGCPAGACWCGL